MEISQLLTTKAENCSKEDLGAAISTLKTALRSKTNHFINYVDASNQGESKQWLTLIRCDTYMLENLTEKYNLPQKLRHK